MSIVAITNTLISRFLLNIDVITTEKLSIEIGRNGVLSPSDTSELYLIVSGNIRINGEASVPG